MKTRVALVAAACLLFWATEHGGAYRRNGPHWASASIVMHLQQGASSGTLMDGSTSWNGVSERALAIWNQYLNGVEFRVVRDSSSGIALGNSINNVFWDDDVYGDAFGDAVAYTKWYYRLSDNSFTETDVVFDRNVSWNSYRGNLRSASGGGWLYDLRRVALHEFGHALGLGHPDDHGQSVTAIMNSRVSNIDSLQADDTNGARAIYGGSAPPPTNNPPPPANRVPTVTASCNPCTVGTGQTTSLSASASDPDGDPLSYQWTASQGTFSNSNGANTVWTAPAQTGNVTATITVQDGRGGRATASVTLQVVPRDTLQAGARLLGGQSLTSSNGRYRLLYQTDGNLVLYDDVDRAALWASQTSATTVGEALLQGDGNFVIYDGQGVARWATGTAGHTNVRLLVQNDGNLVLYRSDGQAIWDRFR